MIAKRLFWMRVSRYMKQQWKTVRLIVDWTIFLYGVVPLLIWAGYSYWRIWQGDFDWMRDVPYLLWTILFGWVMWQDRIFVWVERADIILVSDRSMIRQLKWYSVSYHLVQHVIQYGFYLLLITPILHMKGRSAVEILAFGASLFLLAWCHAWIQYQLRLRHAHLTKRFLIILLAFVGVYALLIESVLLGVLIGSVMVTFALYVGEGWVSRHPSIGREIEIGERERASFDRMLLTTSGAIEKTSERKRPLYRPRPNRFGTVRRTMALLMYFRTPSHRNLWFRLIPLGVTSVILLPSWFKVLVPIYLLYVAYQEHTSFTREMERHPFFQSIQERGSS
ncbi:ABC transporter permease [Exiguobacterium aestuarii]|uniref:ABC transporter permease n=1 Tax=Exiguobacterium aestuarii TaxID=273527 RepID=A0ABW2PMM6_9BACL|nr:MULTISPECIES: ABC transporter permease [Exiguobacterium]MCT4787274.1 ABC transporter permease [Exiguobacterium aestuarii]